MALIEVMLRSMKNFFPYSSKFVLILGVVLSVTPVFTSFASEENCFRVRKITIADVVDTELDVRKKNNQKWEQIICPIGKNESKVKSYGLFSQLCDLGCLSIYEINNIVKLYITSKIIQDFNIRINDGAFEIYISPYITVGKIHIISDERIIPSVAKNIRIYFEKERTFSSYEDIQKTCLGILLNNGVFSPECEVRLDKSIPGESKLVLNIRGYNQIVSDIVLEGLAQDEDPDLLKDLNSIKKDYVKNYFTPSLLYDIEEDILATLSLYGYVEAKVVTEFDSGILKVSINKGKKTVVFLYIEGYEEFGINLKDLRDDMMEKLVGRFAPASIVAYIEDALKNFNLSIRDPKDIKIEEIEVQPNLKVVGITVKPSPAFYLTKFKIHGLKYLSEKDIKDRLGIKTKSILNLFGLRQGIYDERKLDSLISDIPRIASQLGFEEFKIQKVEKRKEHKNIQIDVFVDEGNRLVISDILLINFPTEISDKVKDILPPLPTFYDADKVISIKSKIQDYLISQGFSKFDIIEQQERESKRLVKIYFVYHGYEKKGRVGYVFINSKTNQKFIKDISGIKEGIIFTENLVDEGLDSLKRTQYFDSVNIGYTSGNIAGNSERLYYVLVNSQDGKRNEVELSLGLSSVEGVRGKVGFLSRNIFFYGADFRSNFSLGYWAFPFGRDYGVTFLNFLLELSRRKFIAGFDSSVFFSPLYISTFIYSIAKPLYVGLSSSRSFGAMNLSILSTFESRELITYKFETSPEVGSLNQIYSVSSVFSISKPSFGVGLKLESIFSKILSQKIEVGGRYSLLYDFGGIGIFATGGRIFTKDMFYVPIERRFFLGGIGGPRGYQEISIYSQKLYDTKTSAEFRDKSENYFLVVNELYLVKIGFIRPYLFFDIGSVFQDGESPYPFKGVGAGMMFITSFGDIRADLGYGVEKNIFMIHFTVGAKKTWF